MRVSLVVAMAHDGVIGRDGGMPWHLPAELKRFRAITLGKPIVMGRRTHDSIGRTLPGRRNIVLSRDPAYRAAEGSEVFPSLDAALAALADCEEVMIIGGATLYAEALPRATRLHLTEIDAELVGDTWFPAFDRDPWREVASEARGIEADNPLAWRHVVLEREAAP